MVLAQDVLAREYTDVATWSDKTEENACEMAVGHAEIFADLASRQSLGSYLKNITRIGGCRCEETNNIPNRPWECSVRWTVIERY